MRFAFNASEGWAINAELLESARRPSLHMKIFLRRFLGHASGCVIVVAARYCHRAALSPVAHVRRTPHNTTADFATPISRADADGCAIFLGDHESDDLARWACRYAIIVRGTYGTAKAVFGMDTWSRDRRFCSPSGRFCSRTTNPPNSITNTTNSRTRYSHFT